MKYNRYGIAGKCKFRNEVKNMWVLVNIIISIDMELNLKIQLNLTDFDDLLDSLL